MNDGTEGGEMNTDAAWERFVAFFDDVPDDEVIDRICELDGVLATAMDIRRVDRRGAKEGGQ